MPEKDNTKHFIISLAVQQLYREILSVVDEHGGKLIHRVMMFSVSRSRRVYIVAIIQSFAQLEKTMGRRVTTTTTIIINN
ncbi:MAG: type IV secretory system conjugative DNA transfer family protein [Anaerocolumna sp.]